MGQKSTKEINTERFEGSIVGAAVYYDSGRLTRGLPVFLIIVHLQV